MECGTTDHFTSIRRIKRCFMFVTAQRRDFRSIEEIYDVIMHQNHSVTRELHVTRWIQIVVSPTQYPYWPVLPRCSFSHTVFGEHFPIRCATTPVGIDGHDGDDNWGEAVAIINWLKFAMTGRKRTPFRLIGTLSKFNRSIAVSMHLSYQSGKRGIASAVRNLGGNW